MIVNCDNCGKQYKLDPANFKGKTASVSCTACKKKFKVHLPDPGESSEDNLEELLKSAPTSSNGSASSPSQEPVTHVEGSKQPPKKRFLGLRGKMFLLFFMIPLIVILVSSYLFMGQLHQLSTLIGNESSKAVTDIAEDIITQRAQDVANEVRLYLDLHPYLYLQPLEGFDKDPGLMASAVQRVGQTGYTVITEINKDHKWINVAGPAKTFRGKDASKMLNEKLGDKEFHNFMNMREKAETTKKMVTGYYRFVDGRYKFQALCPVEGTNYWVAATTYMDEFTQPMDELKERALTITKKSQQIVLMIFGITAVLVALITTFYGSRLSGKIKKLTNVADQISMGDMEVVIESKDTDEIGELTDSIARMQDSIRLSLQRLRKRGARR